MIIEWGTLNLRRSNQRSFAIGNAVAVVLSPHHQLIILTFADNAAYSKTISAFIIVNFLRWLHRARTLLEEAVRAAQKWGT